MTAFTAKKVRTRKLKFICDLADGPWSIHMYRSVPILSSPDEPPVMIIGDRIEPLNFGSIDAFHYAKADAKKKGSERGSG
jgi:hypothetical protein